jgi:hypothetical protein
LAKRGKAGKQQRFYDRRRASPKYQYDQFLRSPKADEPSEDNLILVDMNESSYLSPLTARGGFIVASAPPPTFQSQGEKSPRLYDFLKIVAWILGLAFLIGGILWSAFDISHDVTRIKEDLSELRQKDLKTLQNDMDNQKRMMNELLQEKKSNDFSQKKVPQK